MGPFDRFNDRAKRVLALSQDEAMRFGNNYIGPEHLLLGLIREGEGVAANVLRSLGVDLSKVRTAFEHIIGHGDAAPTEITITARTKRVIELAIDEAKRLGHSHVGTEHLLLGLARDGGVHKGMLEALGVSLETVRQRVIDTLGQAAMAGAPPEVARDLFDAQGRKRDWFCEDVLSGKRQVEVICEDERVLAFRHPYPEAEIHAVVIPKRHVRSLVTPDLLDGDLLVSMVWAVQEAASRLGLATDDRGFQLRSNAGAPGVTPHVHWHVMGPGIPPRPRR